MKSKRMYGMLASMVVLSGMVGCQPDRSIEQFRPEHEPRQVHHFTNTQAALGARADATLQAHHFDGEALNSLGREKLGLMIQVPQEAPLVVYLNLPEDQQRTEAQQQAVMAYLQEQGLAEERFSIELGRNPAALSPAAKHLAGMDRLAEERSRSDARPSMVQGRD